MSHVASDAGSQPFENVAPPLFRTFNIQGSPGTWKPSANATVMPGPQPGSPAQIRIYFPEASGQRAFAYIFTFEDPDRLASETYRIAQARTWLRFAERDQSGNILRYVRLEHPLDIPAESAIGRAVMFRDPPIIPSDGLIAEIALESLQTRLPGRELKLHIYVAVLSKSPIQRLLKYEGVETIYWQ